jgi:hypothetical protein
MKKILLLFIVAFAAFGFTGKVDSESIIKALKTGNAEVFASYFDSFIDLKLPEKDELKNMGKNQATIAIKSFFEDNGIKGFQLTSQREMGSTQYISGKLLNNGKGFNITIMMKKTGDKEGIVTVRIN